VNAVQSEKGVSLNFAIYFQRWNSTLRRRGIILESVEKAHAKPEDDPPSSG
jgi:hypothetical protein